MQYMLPILLVGYKGTSLNEYVRDVMSKNDIPPSHVMEVHPESKIITIGQIRQIQSFSQRSSSLRSLIVLHQFHTAKKESQNAFLKTLEEASDHIQFILCVDDETQVLPTIASRSYVIRSRDHAEASWKTVQTSGLDTVDSFSGWMSASAQLDKDVIVTIFDELVLQCHAALLNNPDVHIAKAIQHLLQTRQLVRANNLQPEYALDSVGYVFAKSSMLPLQDVVSAGARSV